MANTHKRLKGRCPTINTFYTVTLCCDSRKPLFVNYLNARLIARELALFSKSNSLNTICYVIMPVHIHWLLQLNSDSNLSNLIRNLKILQLINLIKITELTERYGNQIIMTTK
ncbi:transposase [Pseudoalteromonas sp. S3178]|uniref:transposase n=1 Tax=Pseudoalteromonas sp. S3178 TaxID=579532 RepID=UPI0020164E9D|nr:transposase [Pseudoalteromonas sp. S3178]